MEFSLNSSSMPMGKEGGEESGWTSYLQDFGQGMACEPSYCSSLGGGSSLVSDAASCAAWKSSSTHHNSNRLPKKLCFKKTRAKQISEDDPLEDTASSPLNSPKVGELNQAETISRKIDDHLDGSMGKGFDESGHCSGLQTEEGVELNFNGKSSDLKKRGLCLVPLSMLVNYYG